jgi:hypothetical protein
MAMFLSAVCRLDWETCRTVIEKHIPGGVARFFARHSIGQQAAR